MIYDILLYFNCVLIIERRRQWHPTPVLLPGKPHGWKSLVGCSPWDCWGSDMTERLHFHFSLSCIGKGNGNPLQCPCLENPRDRGAWWAAVYGVAESRTRLKWLSNHRKLGFPSSSACKKSTCAAGDLGSILGLGRIPREAIGHSLQYSWASLVSQLVQNPSAMRETWV